LKNFAQGYLNVIVLSTIYEGLQDFLFLFDNLLFAEILTKRGPLKKN